MKVLSPLLKIEKESDFHYEQERHDAFNAIKEYFIKPPILFTPSMNKNMRLYIVASDTTIGSVLAQEDDSGVERPIYYLSRILIDVETRYNMIENCAYACTSHV